MDKKLIVYSVKSLELLFVPDVKLFKIWYLFYQKNLLEPVFMNKPEVRKFQFFY